MNPIFAGLLNTFQPTHVPGLALWLDATQITGLADGAPVSQWNDLSGNNKHVTQATSNLQPLYKVNLQNGKPGVLWDGSNDYLDSASFALAQPYSAIAVVRFGADASNDYVFDHTGVGARSLLTLNAQGGGNTRAPSYFAGSAIQEANNLTVPTTQLLVCTFNGASSVLRRNGAQTLSGNGGANGLGSLRIGARFSATFNLHGSIHELLFYTNLSGSAISLLESYLNAKWAVY